MAPRINRSQFALLKYATTIPSPDLSVGAMASALGVHAITVSVALNDLINRGLIAVTRARYNKISSLKPTFDFVPGGYVVGRKRRAE